ncbi:plant intracellular Ras-group-related LRR protein 3 [Malania oleifera]|uniref:plant intracellular Ras-group-related LRR protein 3 n=1 Tax=Malania oleifera TaxID=397392 RepID=UPI0025AE2E54|nr:plant intracellular Ras-group-related LRR protein 3 [Malania oleifera]
MASNRQNFPILSRTISLFPQLDASKPASARPSVPSRLMTDAAADVARAYSVIQTLGDRPDPSAVEAARAKMTHLKSELPAKKEAEKEFKIYEAAVRLAELYEAYAKRLRDAEKRLWQIYERAVEECLIDEKVVGILEEAAREGGERVELSGRLLRSLPHEAFGDFRGLVALDLSNNQLEVLPDSIAGLQKLEELNLSSNLLESLPNFIGLLPNLKVLNVSGNMLRSLPEAVAHCSSLVELEANSNMIMCLPTDIGYGLLNLTKFSISLNKIHSLPRSIGEMTSLKYLDAHFNELSVVPHSIGRLTNLKVLSLSSNFSYLTELPETIGVLTNLRELDLSNNQIRTLPDMFGRLQDLKKLNLEQNPLKIPPMETVSQGIEAVKEFMAKRWLEADKQPAMPCWVRWCTPCLDGILSGIYRMAAGYLGGGRASRDPFLDQRL